MKLSYREKVIKKKIPMDVISIMKLIITLR